MYALREVLQLQGKSRTISLTLPESFVAQQVEVIVLPIEDQPAGPSLGVRQPRRTPSPLLRGTRITGDIVSPAVDPEDWSALR